MIPTYDEIGQIGVAGTVQVGSEWTTINLDREYENPVVIAGPASSNEADPLTVRIRNVNAGNFEISLAEWEYLDGDHVAENVSYLVVEGGLHELQGGARLAAGFLEGQDHEWASYSIGNFFSSDPVVLTQVMTDNDLSSAVTRTEVTSDNEFEIRIQEEEAADDIHAAERVGFVAISAGVRKSGALPMRTFLTSDEVTHAEFTVPLEAEFTSTPAFFANMQTTNGANTSTVRYTSLDDTDVSFFIEEEQSSDGEVGHIGEVVGGLAISEGAISSREATLESLDVLEKHLSREIRLGYDELETLFHEIRTGASVFLINRAELETAIRLIDLYETDYGPLFTDSGVRQFPASWDSNNNALPRVMHQLYLAVFDAVDATLIGERPDIAEGLSFRSTEYFPGSVPSPTDPDALYKVRINGSLDREWGSVGGYSTNAARRMTGAYLSPGSVAEIVVPESLVNAGYTVRVGGHSWDLSNKNTVNRMYRISNQFDITSTTTRVANPMGGNIYIEVPVGADAGVVNVEFRNTIRAPFFSARGFDETSKDAWEESERHHPGAFADIEGEDAMWTVPSSWVTDLSYDELMEIIDAHSATMQTVSEYVGKNADRHKAVLYMIVDTQIRANAFSIGYPLSNYRGFAGGRSAPLTVGHAYNRIMLHEHGHGELVSFFGGESESINHMLATAVGNLNYGYTLQEAYARSLAYGTTRHTTSDALNSWVVMDEFLNGRNMAYQQGSYRPRGHGDYTEYVEIFGWGAIQNFNRQINEDLDGREWDQWEHNRNNHNRNDRILRLSREAGVDVTPLFHMWGHGPSDADGLSTGLRAERLRPSVEIYDRMVKARNEVPLSQAEWDDVNSRMRPFLNNARGPWEELSENYDVDRGQRAVAKIDSLIERYFPDGRPEAVVVYADEDFGGATWQLEEGEYGIAEIRNSLIGDDNISSIQIPEGWTVTAFQNADGTGFEATYANSMPSLGALDDGISRIQVTSSSIGEVGQVSVSHEWETVRLSRGYVDPVVIAGTPSVASRSPPTVRIANVRTDSFDVQIDEWEYLDGRHPSENVSYMVVEAGEYSLSDGTIWIAGNHSGQDHNWNAYDLGPAFSETGNPIVFANTVTMNDSEAVTTRVNVKSASTFEVRLQDEERGDARRAPETISYLAIQAGVGTAGSSILEAGRVDAGAADSSLQFEADFVDTPGFFAAMQTFNDSDTATLRYKSLDAEGATIFVEEEQSRDDEVDHATESIGYLVLGVGEIVGSALEEPRFLPADFDRNGEVDFADFLILSQNFGTAASSERGDLTGDGLVDFVDFLEFSRVFGQRAAARAILPDTDDATLKSGKRDVRLTDLAIEDIESLAPELEVVRSADWLSERPEVR